MKGPQIPQFLQITRFKVRPRGKPTKILKTGPYHNRHVFNVCVWWELVRRERGRCRCKRFSNFWKSCQWRQISVGFLSFSEIFSDLPLLFVIFVRFFCIYVAISCSSRNSWRHFIILLFWFFDYIFFKNWCCLFSFLYIFTHAFI